jgi:hypothetical protein
VGKRRFKAIAAAVILLLAAIQFIPAGDRNPVVDPSRTIYATEPVPTGVRTILESSCKNCHSNETNWPWYSYIAPISWVVGRDVRQGRSHMNFSEWAGYSPQKREEKLEEICEQIMNGDMPDGKYTLVHRNARLTEPQRAAVCEWTEAVR